MEQLPPSHLYRLTLGSSKAQRNWNKKADASWEEICHKLTDHQVGHKDGTCFVPGDFSGNRRVKKEVVSISLLVLDCDTGEPLEKIRSAVETQGWAAVVYSTHSHMTTETEVVRRVYEEKGYSEPSEYLIHEKGMQEAIAAGAYIVNSGDIKKILVRHNPCPKFRVVIPLATPWLASDYSTPNEANIAWSYFVKGAARMLNLHHDQSCIDSSRLYYLPRHTVDKSYETEIIKGKAMKFEEVSLAEPETNGDKVVQIKNSKADDFFYIEPATGFKLNLATWAARQAKNFDIVEVLKRRRPDIFTGYIVDGYKYHIGCVNSAMHTNQESDNATFVVSPSLSQTGSFVHCCMHAHCREKDRLFFIQKMLECGWLTISDLEAEGSAPVLSYDQAKSLCEGLSQGSTADNIKAILEQLVNADFDPLHLDILLGLIKGKTGTSLKALRQSMSATKEKTSVDLPYFIVQETLKTYFAGGDHLIRAEDKSFWRYNGKYWEPIRNEVVKNYILPIVKNHARPWEGEDYHRMVNHAFDLLVARQAQDVKFFQRLGEMPSVINCQNGELWIEKDGSLELKPHSPTSYLQYVLDYTYDPNATCPIFHKALLQIFEGTKDPMEMARHMQEMMGYFIQPSRFLTCWFMWQGGGGNGKTTLFEILEKLMSRRSIFSERIESLEKNRFALGNLMGKVLFVDDDMNQNAVIPDGILKKLSERKLITGEKKFKDTFEFISSVAVLLLANNPPRCDDLSQGTRRRVRIVPFLQKFRPTKDNPSPFPYIFQHEMSGVLNQLIRGLQRLRERGAFLEPEDCVEARDNWLKNANPFSAFVAECCSSDINAFTQLSSIVDSFDKWQVENRFFKKMSSQQIRSALEGMGYTAKRINGCWRIYGLSIIEVQ